MKVGDMVVLHYIAQGLILGTVLSIEPMEGVYRDSVGGEPVYCATVVWSQPVPPWLGTGNICKVVASLLQVVG